MIGRILYRENCQGILNYVFGKKGMSILGYGNMCSQDISQRFFGNVLHFQGQRNATKNRYAHITLNLPHCEHLDDKAFHELSEEYMEQMGYGEQPYVVVRHNDTKHEHVRLPSRARQHSLDVLRRDRDHILPPTAQLGRGPHLKPRCQQTLP